jgi:hypothetical protein
MQPRGGERKHDRGEKLKQERVGGKQHRGRA